MQQEVVIFLLLALFGFLIWNHQRMAVEMFTDVSDQKPVEPAIIQSIVNSIQSRVPDVVPVQTIYINSLQGDQGSSGYNARMIFMNTRGFFGVQYDIQTDAQGNVLNMTGQVNPSVQGPFQGYAPTQEYVAYDDIQTVLDDQFQKLKNQPDFDTKMNQWLTSQRAMTLQLATPSVPIA